MFARIARHEFGPVRVWEVIEVSEVPPWPGAGDAVILAPEGAEVGSFIQHTDDGWVLDEDDNEDDEDGPPEGYFFAVVGGIACDHQHASAEEARACGGSCAEIWAYGDGREWRVA